MLYSFSFFCFPFLLVQQQEKCLYERITSEKSRWKFSFHNGVGLYFISTFSPIRYNEHLRVCRCSLSKPADCLRHCVSENENIHRRIIFEQRKNMYNMTKMYENVLSKYIQREILYLHQPEYGHKAK